MTENLIANIHQSRLSAYSAECARDADVPRAQVTAAAVASLYAWQVSLSAAWFETLAYTEAIIRNAVDSALRDWNQAQGRSEDWLQDAGKPLSGLVDRAQSEAQSQAVAAAGRRSPDHPRYNVEPLFDDRVAQLSFGNLVHLFPTRTPSKRSQRGTGLTGRENLWTHGLRTAFPYLSSDLTKRWRQSTNAEVPEEVWDGYAVGNALDRLRRLRNRIGHHEQTFRVEHQRRLKDVNLLIRAIDGRAAEDIESLETVRRALAMKPSF